MNYRREQEMIKDWLTTPLTRFQIAGYPNMWEVVGHNAYCLNRFSRIVKGCSYNTVAGLLEEQGTGYWKDQVDRVYLPKRDATNNIVGYELVFDKVDTSGESLGKIVPRFKDI